MDINIYIIDDDSRYDVFVYDSSMDLHYFYHDNVQVLSSMNDSIDQQDRIENYLMRIQLNPNATVTLPEGYSIKFTNFGLKFDYEQVE